MKRTAIFDTFFEQQPPRDFIPLLGRPVHSEKPPIFGMRAIEPGEVDVRGMHLVVDFPDPEGVLETAYADFNTFLQVYDIGGERYPVRLVFGKTRCFEAYIVDISADGLLLTAADTEGIRRGLVFIENLLQKSEGAYLMPGKTERRPHIKDRITRGFFSPTNRPPKNGDELSDDIDYYPEEYLNRLAHDGTNGLWIYTSFRALLPPGMISEYGEGYQRRIEKLNGVIRRCARYGIKVFVFAMEPRGMSDWDMLNKYPESWGATSWDGKKCFCTETAFGKAYCIDSTETMCRLLPGLGGYIAITNGERPTNCSNGQNDCPICGKRAVGEVLSRAVDTMREGMRHVNPGAVYISWTYGHRTWAHRDIADYVRRAPKDVILMQNFDDMGVAEQLGRDRLGVDYWLSYAGPSDMFTVTAEAAKRYGKTLYAKMQVCCSHEVATVPYLPVPGLLFEKFRGAHALGVSGVLECWYFGNYPSLMSKAAGELSFLHDFSDEDAFLEELAALYWGRSRAARVARAWKLFAEGYKQYPLNIMFSYYGPMHDGVVWELQLTPKNFSLPRSWFSTDKPDGDRLCECLLDGHTAQEALILTEQMSRQWKQGVAVLDGVPSDGSYSDTEQRSIAHALDILFESGYNIVRFYTMRDEIGTGERSAVDGLAEMEGIVRREIELSRAMISLCESDARLGYHSEAENYKFFPAKLAHRVTHLERLLVTEFPQARARLDKGLTPFAYYEGEEPDTPHYQMGREALANAAWLPLADGETRFRAAYDAHELYMEIDSRCKKDIIFSPEFRLLRPAPSVTIHADGTVVNHWTTSLYYMRCLHDGLSAVTAMWNIQTVPAEGMRYVITLHRTDIAWTKDLPMKMRLGEIVDDEHRSLWAQEDHPVRTLGKDDVSPGEYGWLMP